MAVRITIDVFSGRPNPVLELGDDDAAAVVERLQPARLLPEDDFLQESPPTLGYRGLIVEVDGEPAGALPSRFRVLDGALLGRGLAHAPVDEAVEDFLLRANALLARSDLDEEFFERLRVEIDRFRELRPRLPLAPSPFPWVEPCECAPIYEPAWWNVPTRQPYNNCYNYATNYRTDTFAQPGQAAGVIYTDLACDEVRAGAVADELVDWPDAGNGCPTEGHLVALVVAPGWDYHWYRKGRNGMWSHKPGSTPVINVDNAGALISDPRAADRGPYTEFCTFMVVMHGHVKVA